MTILSKQNILDVRKETLFALGLTETSFSIRSFPVELPTLPQTIDATLLKAQATFKELDQLFEDASFFNVKAVCINGAFVERAKARLKNTGILLATVIGFPLGANLSQSKADETARLLDAGADEFDMVIALANLKAQNFQSVFEDVSAVVQASKQKTVKVILETSALTPTEMVQGAVIAEAAGAHFIKTSTGFGAYGAKPEEVALLYQCTLPKTQIKASGGIQTKAQAHTLLLSGATRLGTSAARAILEN